MEGGESAKMEQQTFSESSSHEYTHTCSPPAAVGTLAAPHSPQGSVAPISSSSSPILPAAVATLVAVLTQPSQDVSKSEPGSPLSRTSSTTTLESFSVQSHEQQLAERHQPVAGALSHESSQLHGLVSDPASITSPPIFAESPVLLYDILEEIPELLSPLPEPLPTFPHLGMAQAQQQFPPFHHQLHSQLTRPPIPRYQPPQYNPPQQPYYPLAVDITRSYLPPSSFPVPPPATSQPSLSQEPLLSQTPFHGAPATPYNNRTQRFPRQAHPIGPLPPPPSHLRHSQHISPSSYIPSRPPSIQGPHSAEHSPIRLPSVSTLQRPGSGHS